MPLFHLPISCASKKLSSSHALILTGITAKEQGGVNFPAKFHSQAVICSPLQ